MRKLIILLFLFLFIPVNVIALNSNNILTDVKVHTKNNANESAKTVTVEKKDMPITAHIEDNRSDNAVMTTIDHESLENNQDKTDKEELKNNLETPNNKGTKIVLVIVTILLLVVICVVLFVKRKKYNLSKKFSNI